MVQEIPISDYQKAPCLQDGPIALSAQSLVKASLELGKSPFASIMRAWCVPYLFESMEQIFASGEDPVRAINHSLESLTLFIVTAARSGFKELSPVGYDGRVEKALSNDAEVKEVTGNHYGRLFEAFSSTSYWDEPTQLLRQRLERNDISIPDLASKEVLDAGCGGGRYTVAWRLLGAKQATGVDVSTIGITDARQRLEQAGINRVTFEEGNVLDLPYADHTFDIVFSNGVLHHTEDWKRGVAELVRVLKPGGIGWLYLIENPGGIFWDIIEVLRVVMKDDPRDVARNALRILGVPANRVFYMLDHVMVPINVRLTPDEIEECLSATGAVGIRRLLRGTDFDRIEQIYKNIPFAKLKYGVGENRYVFSKE